MVMFDAKLADQFTSVSSSSVMFSFLRVRMMSKVRYLRVISVSNGLDDPSCAEIPVGLPFGYPLCRRRRGTKTPPQPKPRHIRAFFLWCKSIPKP